MVSKVRIIWKQTVGSLTAPPGSLGGGEGAAAVTAASSASAQPPPGTLPPPEASYDRRGSLGSLWEKVDDINEMVDPARP